MSQFLSRNIKTLLFSLGLSVTQLSHAIDINVPTTFSSTSSSAQVRGSVNDYLYYNIGGGSVISTPPSHNKMQKLGIGVNWSSDLMCGNFDIQTTIKNQLNGVTEGFQDMMGNVISSATGAVASLPAMILQRSNPGLYELLTNGMLQANISFDKAQLSCQKMAEKMADYTYSGIFNQQAVAEEYKDVVNSTSDAVKADKELNKSISGKAGAKWIGNKSKGGAGQDAIKPTFDIAKAGYNILNNLPADSNNNISGSSCSGTLCQRYPNAEEAAKVVVEVLGDSAVRTCSDMNDCSSGGADNQHGATTPGVGFNSIIEETTQENYKLLVEMVNGTLKPTDDNLAKLKSGGLPVSRNIIQALKDDPDNSAIVQRLSSELAFSDTIALALSMRRMIVAGSSEPNVHSNEEFAKEIDKRIDTLDREINALKTEMEIRKEISNNSLLTTLARQNERNLQNNLRQSTPAENKGFNNLSKEQK